MFEQIQKVEVGPDDVILVRIEQLIPRESIEVFEKECKKDFHHENVCVMTGPSQIDVVAKRKPPTPIDEEFMSFPEFLKIAALAVLKLTVMPTIIPNREQDEDKEIKDA